MVASWAFVTVAVPFLPFLHGPQSAFMTFPALPTFPMWMCAAAAGPESLENFSCHAIFAPPLAFTTAVPANEPVAPTGTAVGLGTSALALSVVLSFHVVACPAASVRPAETMANARATATRRGERTADPFVGAR